MTDGWDEVGALKRIIQGNELEISKLRMNWLCALGDSQESKWLLKALEEEIAEHREFRAKFDEMLARYSKIQSERRGLE